MRRAQGNHPSPSRRMIARRVGMASGLVVDQKRREGRTAVGGGTAGRAVGILRRTRQRILQRLEKLLQDIVGGAGVRRAARAAGDGWTVCGGGATMAAMMTMMGTMRAAWSAGTALLDDRTKMLAAISHDLRTPITRLRLRSEFIADEVHRSHMLGDLDQMRSML